MEPQAPPIPETDEERERRERLEFFMSHNDSEIRRLADWFHFIVQDAPDGTHKMQTAEREVTESIATAFGK